LTVRLTLVSFVVSVVHTGRGLRVALAHVTAASTASLAQPLTDQLQVALSCSVGEQSTQCDSRLVGLEPKPGTSAS